MKFGLLFALILAAMLLPALQRPAVADQFDPKQVAVDAKWLMHFDFDGFRKTALGKHLREEIDKQPHAQQFFDSIEKQFGLNLRQGLHGITLYGCSYKKHQGILLLTAEFDQEQLIAHLKKQPDYRTKNYHDYSLHSWTAKRYHAACCPDGDRDNNAADANVQQAKTLTAVFHDNVLVMGADREKVEHALDVLDGRESGLKDDSPLLSNRPEGTVFLAAAQDLSELQQRHDSFAKMAVLRQAEQLNVAMGQHNDTGFYKVILQANSPETAQRVHKVIEGFRAMLELQGHVHEKVGKLAEGLNVNTDDSTVTIDWQADASLLVDILHEMATRKRHMHRDHERPNNKDHNTQTTTRRLRI